MTITVIKVDWQGRDASGEEYHFHASPEAVARGWMVNIPTLIQYPDGTLKTGNCVKITRSGMEKLKREVPIEIRETEGNS